MAQGLWSEAADIARPKPSAATLTRSTTPSAQVSTAPAANGYAAPAVGSDGLSKRAVCAAAWQAKKAVRLFTAQTEQQATKPTSKNTRNKRHVKKTV